MRDDDIDALRGLQDAADAARERDAKAKEPRFFFDHDTIHDRTTGKHVDNDNVVDLLNELELDLQEWARVAELQHNTLASYSEWPPTNPQGCGWCIRAAGDTKAAREAAEKFDIVGVRRHSMTCPHNEAVSAAVQQIAAWIESSASTIVEKMGPYQSAFAAGVAAILGDIAKAARAGAWRKP